mmetsp:Transcript_772/g.2742  ORF Transcript_772/g.2742 Transcript_772/m.2742 type:complete len:249 (-) Transcript_772:330-1076(-)
MATCARRQCSIRLLSLGAGALSASSSAFAAAAPSEASHASILGPSDCTNGSFFPLACRNRSRPISDATRSSTCARSSTTCADDAWSVAKTGLSASKPSSSSSATNPSGTSSSESSSSSSRTSATPRESSTAVSGSAAGSLPAGPAPTSCRSLSTLATTLWVSSMSSSVARSSARRFFSLSAPSISSSSFCMPSRCAVICAMSLSSGVSQSFMTPSMSGSSSESAMNLSKSLAVISTSLPSTTLPYASS